MEKSKNDFITEQCMILGENMRAARRLRGFTSEALAKFLDISTAYVGLIERGERTPSLETFLRICEFFGESKDRMLTPSKSFSVAEKVLFNNHDKETIERKRKMLTSMQSTLDLDELEHIINIVKSFKTYSTSKTEKIKEQTEALD